MNIYKAFRVLKEDERRIDDIVTICYDNSKSKERSACLLVVVR